MRSKLCALCALCGWLTCMVALAVMVYLIGFAASWRVPKGVNDGITHPGAVMVDLGLLLLFGLQHSIMARERFKAFWRPWLPAALERSVFVLGSCAALMLLFWLWVPIAEPTLWQVEMPWARGLLWGLCAVGWGLALWSTFLLDHAELFGLRQALGWPARTPPELRTPGLYRWVRHPLYLGMLTGLWAAPTLTAGQALLSGGLTLYVLVGIWFEERDLVARFGRAYLDYRGRAGALLPRWRG